MSRPRISIITDKWKGTLSAHQACHIIAAKIAEVSSDIETVNLPMSDGGEGFGEIIGSYFKAQSHTVETLDAAHRPINAQWWSFNNGSSGVFETSVSNGLALLPAGVFHPFDCDTYGVGLMLKQILSSKVKDLYLGIGGSATNDGGFGMARALGFQFFDKNENEILAWTQLIHLVDIRPPKPEMMSKISQTHFTVACDVQNPLLGSQGATEIYGPQKGLISAKDKEKAEAALEQLSRVSSTHFENSNYAEYPGSGAAGGLGFGLKLFCQADFTPGFKLFSELSNLEEVISKSDLVITGEGAIDQSTMMGKGAGQIFDLCERFQKPVIAVCGKKDGISSYPSCLKDIWVLSEMFSMEECLNQTESALGKMLNKKLDSNLSIHLKN